MEKISYFKMFDAEALYAKSSKKLFRLEDMNYDTSYFKIPKIFKNLVDQIFKYNTITYSDFGGFPRLKNLIINYEKTNSGINKKHDTPFVFVSNGVSSLLLGIIQLVPAQNLTQHLWHKTLNLLN